MYEHAELVHWFQNPSKIIIPGCVDIDLTNVCDQDCFYCNSAEFRKTFPGQKTFDDYIRLVDQLATWRKHSPDSYGTLHTIIFVGGGEPTLFKDYEKIIEHSIDAGFLCSLTTNGSKLDNLVKNVNHDKIQKMGWIGVDVDAGTEELYEQIRHTKSKESIFSRVRTNIKMLTDIGVNVDLKILLNEYNSNESALRDIFIMAKELSVRQIYFRPVILNDQSYSIDKISSMINLMSLEFQINVKFNTSKNEPRTYNKCHQMFQHPSFTADGEIYVCCENKGNPRFSIGNWVNQDFRDIWLKNQHMTVYNSINTNFCGPCRSNKHNNKIQEILNDPAKIERLYY